MVKNQYVPRIPSTITRIGREKFPTTVPCPIRSLGRTWRNFSGLYTGHSAGWPPFEGFLPRRWWIGAPHRGISRLCSAETIPFLRRTAFFTAPYLDLLHTSCPETHPSAR